MTAYYNEIDKTAAAWLRNLINNGLIAPGVVDERDIRDVRPNDLRGFTQHHFFAGIGIWSYGARRAGWPDRRPVATASLPCQPFSEAGRGAGFADERHLWPHFYHLVQQCGFRTIFGEQVASKDGLAWFDLVQPDLENENYTVWAADLCAAGFGAPHIRQRLYWGADLDVLADCKEQRLPRFDGESRARSSFEFERSGLAELLERHGGHGDRASGRSIAYRSTSAPSAASRARPTNGPWRDADWLHCRDGKWRPVEPGTFPLAHGAASRVGRLRAYGNGVVAAQVEEWVRAYLDEEAAPRTIDAEFSVVTVAELLG